VARCGRFPLRNRPDGPNQPPRSEGKEMVVDDIFRSAPRPTTQLRFRRAHYRPVSGTAYRASCCNGVCVNSLMREPVACPACQLVMPNLSLIAEGKYSSFRLERPRQNRTNIRTAPAPASSVLHRSPYRMLGNVFGVVSGARPRNV